VRKALFALLSLAVGLGMAVPAAAQVPPRPVPVRTAPAPSSASIDVELMVVHATRNNDSVDRRLEGLLAHLRHLGYSGYSVIRQNSASMSDGDTADFTVVGDREVKAELISHTDTDARLRIRMFKSGNKVLDTTVNMPRNRSFIVMGPEYDGGVLILPITVRY